MDNSDQILPVSKIVASSQPYNRNFIQSLKPSISKQTKLFNSHRPFATEFSFSKDDKSITLQRQSSSRSRSNVGPGSYEIQSPAHLQSNRPKISIGKGFRSELTKSINPGPGQYNIPSVSASKTFVFNSRPVSANSRSVPGPGTYDLTANSQRSYSFGTARKLQFFNMSMNTPGPGAYKIDFKAERKKVDRIERLLKPKVMVRSYYNQKEDKALQEKKPQLSNKPKRPKSAYQIKNEARRKKINKVRLLSKEQWSQPGPGSYEIKDFIKEDHIMEKKSGVRHSQSSEKQKKYIGPGTYELRDFLDQPEYIKRGTTGLGFGKSKRFKEQKLSNDLGPGSYEIINDY